MALAVVAVVVEVATEAMVAWGVAGNFITFR
jgi:hypothetical protein